MPFCLYRPKPDGKGKDVVTDHWLAHLIGQAAEPLAEPVRVAADGAGAPGVARQRLQPHRAGPARQIAELVPLHPDRMRVEVLEENTRRYRYRYTQRDGSDEILPSGSVWHLRGLSSNGFVGLNPIEVARESLGAALAAQDLRRALLRTTPSPAAGSSTRAASRTSRRRTRSANRGRRRRPARAAARPPCSRTA
jgi:hypothetical protein